MTNRVLLRDVTESDLPIFYEQQLDPDATAMAAFSLDNAKSCRDNKSLSSRRGIVLYLPKSTVK